MGNTIDTERLRLRQLDLAEARALLVGEPADGLRWLHGYPTEGTFVAVESYVRGAASSPDSGPYGVYQLVRLADAVVVGDIGFHAPPNERGALTVGYGLAPAARGHGYATEGLRALIAWALDQPGVTAVEGDTTHANVASQRVMERAGMRLVNANSSLHFYRVP